MLLTACAVFSFLFFLARLNLCWLHSVTDSRPNLAGEKCAGIVRHYLAHGAELIQDLPNRAGYIATYQYPDAKVGSAAHPRK